MTHRRDRESFGRYFREIADRMRLKDWTIVVLDALPSGNALATVCRTTGRKQAQVYLSDHFLRDDESEQRDTVVHELVHCIQAATDSEAYNAMSTDEWGSYSRASEYAVDDLAAIIAPLMPLPSDILDAPSADSSR